MTARHAAIPCVTACALAAALWHRGEHAGLTVLVNSSIKYACKTLPVLLPSLRQCGVPDGNVVVVIGDNPDGVVPQCVRDVQGSQRVYTCPYNAVDLSAMVYAAENDVVHTPWLFSLHDTTKAGPRFWDILVHIYMRQVRDSSVDVWQLLSKFSMSMGFVRTSWLRTLDLSDVKLINPEPESVRQMKTWIEDYPFTKTSNTRFLKTFGDNRVPQGHFKYDDDSQPRFHEYYEIIDLHKFKSYVGQPGPPPIRA